MRIVALLSLVLALGAQAGPVQVENLRTWPAPSKTRLVFDVSAPVEHNVFTLGEPDRVVVDLKQARLVGTLAQPKARDRALRRVRSAARPNGDLRVVLDLKTSVRVKTFLLRPNRRYGHRLVLDLLTGEDGATVRTGPGGRGAAELRDVVVAIDAGHGGEDPGAHGTHGTREKDVVLAIARELRRLVGRERGMRPFMVRKGDYYIGLRKRMRLARKHEADIFVSIHADAFRDPKVRGASVYCLSQHGASSEAARWLAARENSADLIGGVSLDDKDDLLASVLIDLSQTAAIEASLGVGQEVLRSLKTLGKVHKRRVQQAGFAVLKSPDVPSILVETAFISNPQEEKRLRDRRHQRALARAMMAGLRAYFAENAPPGTLLAATRHTVVRGDTLADLARQYHVSLKRLRTTNGLRGDRLSVGEVLSIPQWRGG